MEYNDYTGNLASRIAELRRRAGMTQEALAEKLGVTFQAVSKWERGQSCPDIGLLPELAGIFGVSLDELFGTEPLTEHTDGVREDIPEIGCESDDGENGSGDIEAAEGAKQNGDDGKQDGYELEPDGKGVFIGADGVESHEKIGLEGDEEGRDAPHAKRKETPWYQNIFDRHGYRARSEYIPQDDGKLRVLLFRGNRMLEKYDEPMEKITFEYDGEALDVISMLSVKCGDVGGDVNAGASVECENIEGSANAGSDVKVTEAVEGSVSAGKGVTCGDVGGDIYAGGNVTCGSTDGDIKAGGSVSCTGDVEGDIETGGNVTCGDVEGNIKAGGGVSCTGDVEGDIKADGSVTCGNVEGSVNAGNSVECLNIEGSVEAGGDVTCGDVGGDIDASGSVNKR